MLVFGSAVGPVRIPVNAAVPATARFPLKLTNPALLTVNLAAPSVVTVKAPSVPVSVTVAFVFPIAMLVFVKDCQLGPDPEPLLERTCPLVP